MKQLTRKEVEAVVEMLQEKDECMDPRYCVVCKRRRNTQITIGHVLSKIDKTVGGRNYYIGQTTYNDELIHLWSRCGELTQSLQEIVEASGWNEIWGCGCVGSHLKNGASGIPLKHISQKHPSKKMEVLKSPEANALFSFLLQIGL